MREPAGFPFWIFQIVSDHGNSSNFPQFSRISFSGILLNYSEIEFQHVSETFPNIFWWKTAWNFAHKIDHFTAFTYSWQLYMFIYLKIKLSGELENKVGIKWVDQALPLRSLMYGDLGEPMIFFYISIL